jgi:membrane-bound lytic murein transglycosylase D
MPTKHRHRRRRRPTLRSWWSSVRTAWMVRTGRPPPTLMRSLAGAGGAAAFLVAAGFAYARLATGAPAATHVPELVRLPTLPVLPDRFEGVSLEAHLAPVLTFDQRDEILASPVLRDEELARRVHWWVDYWKGPARAWFPGFLERMAWLGPSVDSALATHAFPPSLRYLPLIESGYAPGVTSGARAVGLWQLMSPTARELGLEVGPLLDERRHIDRSTEAALRYIASLRDEFDSWFLVLAAYNSGPTRVRGILRRHAPGEPRTDSLFWALRHHFPAETRDFVPKLYGAMWVASRPEAYGYATPTVPPLAFDAVRVPDQTTLDVVARVAGATHEEIVRLNPEFIRGITPADRAVRVRVPRGMGRTFALNYAVLPPSERVTFVEHVVEHGETLSLIALRYGVRVTEIEAANPSVRALALSVGARLTVPVAPSVRTSASGADSPQ